MQETIITLPYSLPDAEILADGNKERYKIWRPDKTYIVLGRSNKAESSVNTDNVIKDGIMVMQRSSGGHTVVLTPATIVFSIKIPAKKLESPRAIFDTINKSLIEEFHKKGVEGICSRGISDLSIGDQKIMGSSMNLKEGTYFYHAVLNISEDPTLISKYLKHPAKEPDYRLGRDHSEFVTSLWKKGYRLTFNECIEILINSIEETLKIISFKE